MRLPWRKEKPLLQHEITLKVGTLLGIMDATQENEWDVLEHWIAERRAVQTALAEEAKDTHG